MKRPSSPVSWWSIPFFAVGMYDLFIGSYEGFTMLVLAGVTSITYYGIRRFNKIKFIPWWAIPFYIVSVYEFQNYMSNIATILVITTSLTVALFLFMVYQYRKEMIVCKTCNEKVHLEKGKLPMNHRSGKCKK
jgi:hypothetical protein